MAAARKSASHGACRLNSDLIAHIIFVVNSESFFISLVLNIGLLWNTQTLHVDVLKLSA